MCDALAGPDCQLQASLQVKERDRPIFELFVDDSFRLEAKAVSKAAIVGRPSERWNSAPRKKP